MTWGEVAFGGILDECNKEERKRQNDAKLWFEQMTKLSVAPKQGHLIIIAWHIPVTQRCSIA